MELIVIKMAIFIKENGLKTKKTFSLLSQRRKNKKQGHGIQTYVKENTKYVGKTETVLR